MRKMDSIAAFQFGVAAVAAMMALATAQRLAWAVCCAVNVLGCFIWNKK